ncbi:MAG: O-antigen ligase family protein [Candidatus Omnitrophica bacterium]|nr:O-antigen ligase family protein [Candidatus Omnitrophota bacterium]MDD5429432.1 O-antigen ligase family protein [Candidatus Omnitrophota bacterium]
MKEKALNFIDKSAFVFFGILVFFLPISSAVIESCFGFIFFCFILKVVIKRPDLEAIKEFFKERINLSLLVFYIFIGVSMINSGPYFAKSFSAWFFKWGEGVLLFYFGQVFLDKKKVKILLLVFVFSGVLVSIDGIYQKIFGIDFIRDFSLMAASGFNAITATFRHYNNFSSFLIVLFFINCGFLIKTKTRIFRVFLFLSSLFIVIDILFTYSRGAWLSFLMVSFFLAVFFTNKRIRATSLVFLLVFTLGIASLPAIRERFAYIFQIGGDTDRFRVWSAAILMFKASPLFGQGLGTFMDYINKYGSQYLVAQYAHNCYLQILAETGIAGLLSFLWFLGELMFRGYYKLKKTFNFLFIGLFCGILAFLVHSFFDTQLFSLKLSVLFWVMASFLAVYIHSGYSTNCPGGPNKQL